MPRYRFHFSLGNSNTGPVGFCAAVFAHTPEEAVAILRNELPSEIRVPLSSHEKVEYVEVYLNGEAVTTADIDEDQEA